MEEIDYLKAPTCLALIIRIIAQQSGDITSVNATFERTINPGWKGGGTHLADHIR